MSQRRDLPEKPPVAQLLIQFPVFYTTRQFITIFTTASLTPSNLIALAHPPTFCFHIYSSLNNIPVKVHMFSALQTQCWHTKMRDKQSETLTDQAIPNLMYQSDIGTNNTSWSSNLKPHHLNLTTLLNLNNQTKMTITNTSPTLSCLYWTGTTKTLT